MPSHSSEGYVRKGDRTALDWALAGTHSTDGPPSPDPTATAALVSIAESLTILARGRPSAPSGTATDLDQARDLLCHGDALISVEMFGPGNYDPEPGGEEWIVVLNLGMGDESICRTGEREAALGIALALSAAFGVSGFEAGVVL